MADERGKEKLPSGRGAARCSEIDRLNGLIMRRAEVLEVATPVNRVLRAFVKLMEGAVRA